MQRKLLEWLVCPKCRGELAVTVHHEAAEIEEGVLGCSRCAAAYPIVRGIPRFVQQENYATTFGHQWTRYARLQLDSQNQTTFSRDRFYSITEWNPSALAGKLVLDAGCGSGRFAEVALATGAEVIALDLSSAVDPCRTNLGSNPRLHCVQASIYELPFRGAQFDYVYCIGVIQHTPDPKKSVLSLLDKVAVGGSVGLWIYELTWKSFVGTMAFKNFLRPWTKRWSIARLEKFSDRVERLCWPVLRWARHRGTLGKAVMRLLPTASAHIQAVPLSDADFREWVRLDTFDMYSPAHDHAQTFPCVKTWLENAGFRVDPRHPHGAVSITGTRLG
jgi:2-polyprenyl-3-methyl-5-hydroxy-6-metoxy-1,4-benzoquinol methylase